MATPGISYELSENDREYAIKYVEEGGYYKNRLADFLGISRPTLDKLLEENPDFFTALKRADAVFCKSLIDLVKKKNPSFLLKTKYREEFDITLRMTAYDPEEEIKKLAALMDSDSEEIDDPFEDKK